MDKKTALDFLSKHQPMPPDDKLTEDMMKQYDEVIDYFINNPDTQCIPLLLNSYGDGEGNGLYEQVEQVFYTFTTSEVVPHLIKALKSEHAGVRYWCSQIAMDYSVPEMIEPLKKLLKYDEIDETRQFAAAALEDIQDKRVDEIFECQIKAEQDSELRGEMKEALKRRSRF